jgi:hypothetical protein
MAAILSSVRPPLNRAAINRFQIRGARHPPPLYDEIAPRIAQVLGLRSKERQRR